MKVFKIIFKILLVLLIGVAIAAVVIPIVFKDDIVQGVKNAINDNVNAKVDFDDASLSLINSFPNASVTVDGLVVVGVDKFENIPLAKADKATVKISLASLFDKSTPVTVLGMSFDSPDISLFIDKNQNVNYDIIKESESSAEGNFVLELQQYEIRNGSLTFDNRANRQYFLAENIDHIGHGNFVNSSFDLTTETTIGDLSYVGDGFQFLDRGTAKGDVIIAVDLAQNKYTFSESDITINELDLVLDGFMQLNENDIAIDMTFDAPNENAKGVMSIIPGIYSADYADAEVTGTTQFSGKVKGKYIGGKNIYPALGFNAKIQNGSLKYPALPKSLTGINIDMSLSAKQGDYSDMFVNVPAFDLMLGDNPLKGSLVSQSVAGDMDISGELEGKVVLQDWKSALPSDDIEMLNGTIDSDIRFSGKQSDAVAKNYDKLMLDGKFQGNNIVIKIKDRPAIKIEEFESGISPQVVNVNFRNAKIGQSDAKGSLEIVNPLAYVIPDAEMETTLKTTSILIDVNEWMTEPKDQDSTSNLSIPESVANVNLDIASDKFIMNSYEVKSMKLKATHRENGVKLENLSGMIGSSDFTLKGQVDNTLGYFNDNEILSGNLDLNSSNLIMEDFMTSDASSSSKEVVLIPENVDLSINAKVGTAYYDKIQLKDLKGMIAVANSEAILENGLASGLGGNINFSGLYGTPEGEKPDFAFKYDLSKLSFEQMASSVDMTAALVPLMKYIGGTFNSTLVMEGKLDDNMFPDISSINASGFLETISAQLEKLDVVNKLADLLGIEELRKIDIDHTKNWFDIIDGMVEVKPFDQKIAGIDMTISGKHGLTKPMEYQIIMNVPRDKLQGNVVTGAADKGLKILEREAAKLGVNIDQGDFIKLKVDITGTMQAPSFKVTPLSSGGKSTKDVVDEKIEDIKETLQDSVKKVIDKNTQIVKDTIASTVQTAKDSVKTVIDETVQTATDSAKTVVKDVVSEQIDKVLKDSTAQEVKDQINDAINGQGDKTIDDIKEKLEDWNIFKKKKKKGN